MSTESDKCEELTRRVGNAEPHFCGRCKRQTRHTLIRDTEKITFGSNVYHFKLKCGECGNTDHLFSY